MNIAALLLAAGSSSRMGRPKQLLEYQGHPLVRRAAETALVAGLAPVLVMLGASSNEIRPTVSDLPIDILENPEWPRGMGATLRSGITHLMKSPTPPDAVLLLLCDQPLLTADHLRALIAQQERTQKGLVAAAYNGTCGVPALIARHYFAELQTLPDAGGAKVLFARHPQDLAMLPLPEAALDVDDPAAYAALIRRTPGAAPR